MLHRLVLIGATGDLAGRFLLPALAGLLAMGKLPAGFEVIGVARPDFDDDAFRRYAAEQLDEHATDVSTAARDALVRSMRFRQADISEPDRVGRVIRDDVLRAGAEPIAVYLALPPALFSSAVVALGAVGLPSGSRIALEKPFGEDLDSAVELNRLLANVSGVAGENAIFRVDHVLGMATVHNVLSARLANRVFEPVWNSAHIERVEILWEETLALEGRARYYDRAGALKDVMQNHMLQVLCLIAMEPPATLAEHDLRDRRIDLLRSVRPLAAEEVVRRTRRARYTCGRVDGEGGETGRVIPSYVDEDGVEPRRNTETFAEVVLDVDNERWAGTTFVLRAGKAMRRRRKGVIMWFRPVPHSPFFGDTPPANQLRIGLDGPESLTLHLTGSAAGPAPELVPLTMTAELPSAELPPYGYVLLDILNGESTLSIRGDEAEESWRIMMPVLRAWAAGRVPMEEYVAGSSGPVHDALRE